MNKIQSFVLSVSFILIASTSVLAQPDSSVSVINKTAAVLKSDEGYGLLLEGQIKSALVKFQEALEKNPYSSKAYAGEGECYYKLLNFNLALKAGLKAYALDKESGDAAFLIGAANHRLGELDEALKFYEIATKLYKEAESKELNIAFIISCVNYAKNAVAGGQKFVRKPMNGANSDYWDYAPLLFDGGKRLYFVSRRNSTTGGRKNPSDENYFEDIYEAVWNPRSQEWDSVSNKLGKLNSAGFDAISFVSADGERLYVTINNTMDPKVKSKDITGSSDIAMAKIGKSGAWPKPKLLEGGINTDFFEGSPTLTKDEQTLYFVAQRRTSEGNGTEIMVSRLEGKTWGKAVALSAAVNNSGRQTTPFITPDGNYLFFSSDSHVGLGGFDIYVSKYRSGDWSTPINLGYGINSVNDDTHFKYYPELKKAVLASVVVDGSKATYNMYTVDMSNFDLDKLDFVWSE